MLVNCVAYQDGRKLADIDKREISDYLKRPGCFVMMGQQGPDKGGVPVHHPAYDFNDAMLPVGASYFATLVEQELARR